MKPIRPALTDDELQDYRIDALIRDGTSLSAEIQTAVRNLLLACELGALVIVQCTRKKDSKEAFILCAYAETQTKEERIIPICVLDLPADINEQYLPPPYTARKGKTKMVRTHFSNAYIEPVAVEDGVVVLAEVSRSEDDNVH